MFFIVFLLVTFGKLYAETTHQQLIDNYSSSYCLTLEAAYGKGMMSEGGIKAIEDMFKGIHLDNKKVLDIGSGLGGLPFYLAKEHHSQVTGVEINPWMVEEATKRTPLELAVDFVLINEDNLLPFENDSFDIVSSKGVLTHVQDKTVLFREIFRVLKPNGILVVEDWLSPIEGHWGEKLTKMALSEGLLLFAETEPSYIRQLEHAGFDVVEMRSENAAYSRYNRDIAKKLSLSDSFREAFGKELQDESIAGYNLIADSIDSNELLIRHFEAVKR